MHRLLERQIKRVLDIEPADWPDAVEKLLNLADEFADRAPRATSLLVGLPALFERVSESYAQLDRDTALVRRSLELSSAELTEANQRLRAEAKASGHALQALRDAFDLLVEDFQSGLPEGETTSLVDISEKLLWLTRQREAMRKALAHSEERFNLAMQGANDGLWDWDLVSNKVYYSPRWKEMIGHTIEEVGDSGEEWVRRLHPDDRQSTQAILKAYLSQPQGHYECKFRFLHKDGDFIWVLSRGMAVLDESGKPIRIVGTHTDITDTVTAQESLRAAKEAAEAANLAKSEFLAKVSHEIRTPMNGVLGMLDLALATKLDIEQREYIDIAHRSADSLMDIINDILDLSKIEAGRLEIHNEAFKLTELLNDLAVLFERRCQAKHLDFRLYLSDDLPTRVLGDVTRIRQVLVNLLGNAIKFTGQGGITLSARREPDGGIRFAVRDTGIGIAEDKQAAVFDAFTQADGTITRKFGGTGLGLTISENLVRLMSGQFALWSKLGEGSEFSFTLPLAPVDDKPSMVSAPSPASLRVLLAEDNVINQKLATTLLRKAGHHVDCVASGAEVLAALASQNYDVVLMDMQMPDMDGIDATRRIRAQEEIGNTARQRIIAVTGNVAADDRQRCLQAGMDDFLGKPLKRDDLFAALARAVGG